jgi:hypothetical protein
MPAVALVLYAERLSIGVLWASAGLGELLQLSPLVVCVRVPRRVNAESGNRV